METYSFLMVSFLVLGFVATSVHGQGTRVGFYSDSCPRAESIVKSTVKAHFQSNPRIAPGILRMHFHDCFIKGCDGSILIDGPNTEKTAFNNVNIPGYNVIDAAKAQLEAVCPGVVSCADILALAARDSVVLTRGSSWKVPTGRRDGRDSSVSDTVTLPGPREPIASQIEKFKNLGLNTQDLVTLVGGHTIGTTSCAVFRNRLFNFNTTTGADPTIDASFVPTLRAMCPQGGDASRRVDIDNGSGARFDMSFFTNLRNGRGIFESDQMLWTDPSTRTFVERLLSGTNRGRGATKGLNFDVEFGKSMVKMSNIGVKTGSDGEIRTICTGVN